MHAGDRLGKMEVSGEDILSREKMRGDSWWRVVAHRESSTRAGSVVD